MGGAASSTTSRSASVRGLNAPDKNQSSSRNSGAPSPGKKSLKVPLHIALRAIVIIQKRVRMRIAYKRLLKLMAIKAEQDAAARKYLNDLKEQMEYAKANPPKPALNNFAPSLTMFNKFDTLETVGGDYITVDDYFEANKLSPTSLLIYPSLGFVIKSKTADVGRKVFINVVHHELVTSSAPQHMKYTQPRLLVNTTTAADGSYDITFDNVLVFDVLMSSAEFNENFVYKQGVGVQPVSNKIKNKISETAIQFLNSFEHTYNNSHPYYHNNSTRSNTAANATAGSPQPAMVNGRRARKSPGKPHNTTIVDETVQDFKIALGYKFPKIKRCYMGDVTPMVYALDSQVMQPVYYSHNHKLHAANKSNNSSHDGTNKSTQQLNPPPLLRNWLVLPTEQQQQLLLASVKQGGGDRFTREAVLGGSRSNSFDGTADKLTELVTTLVPHTGAGKHDTPYFNTTENHRVGTAGGKRVGGKRPGTGDSDDEGKGDLEESHVRYFKRLNDLLTGVVAYVVVNHGALTLYYSTNASADNSSGPLNTAPYGFQEYTKVLLFNYHIAVSIDNVNNIFYLQLLSNPPSPLDTYSMLFNQYDSVNDEVILQFKSYNELLAWKLYLQAHIEYSVRALKLLGTHNKMTTINHFPAYSIPEVTKVWTTRVRSGSGNNVLGGLNYISTTKVYMMIGMGLLRIYSDETAKDSTLIECISLQNITVLVRKGAMTDRALRTCDVLISLMRDHYFEEECATDIIAEFIYYHSPPDDPKVSSTIDGLYKNIHFATHHAYSYMIPLLEYNHRLTLEDQDIKLTTVTIDMARLTSEKESAEIERQREEDDSGSEANSDDDVTTAPAPAAAARKKSLFGKKELKIREEVFRCITTTKDYKSRTDLNKFPTPLTASLHSRTNHANNTYTLLLCEDKLLIYQHMCFVAAINVAASNIELVTPLPDITASAASAKQRKGSITNVPGSELYKVQFGKSQKDAGEQKIEEPVVYDAWQITIVTSNSLKYRIRFPNEAQYLDWLRVIDKNSECDEHRKSEPPTPEEKLPEEQQDTMLLSDDDEEEAVMLRERAKSGTKEDAISAPTATSNLAMTLANFQAQRAIKGSNPEDAIDKNIDNNATKKYVRMLRDGEKVVACGMVQKFDPKPKGAFAAPSTKRIVLLTTTPRMMYLDPISNVVRGHSELGTQGVKIEYKMTAPMEWELTVSGTTTKFTVCDDKDAKFWVNKLRIVLTK